MSKGTIGSSNISLKQQKLTHPKRLINLSKSKWLLKFNPQSFLKCKAQQICPGEMSNITKIHLEQIQPPSKMINGNSVWIKFCSACGTAFKKPKNKIQLNWNTISNMLWCKFKILLSNLDNKSKLLSKKKQNQL